MNWTRTDRPESSYRLTLPESEVLLTYHQPPVEPDFVTLEVISADGVSAGVLAAAEPDEQDPDPNPDWPLLRSLYIEAHRFVTGWDRTLSDVEKALAGPGPIGAKPQKMAAPTAELKLTAHSPKFARGGS